MRALLVALVLVASCGGGGGGNVEPVTRCGDGTVLVVQGDRWWYEDAAGTDGKSGTGNAAAEAERCRA